MQSSFDIINATFSQSNTNQFDELVDKINASLLFLSIFNHRNCIISLNLKLQVILLFQSQI